jgi:hypothetical protein
MERHSAYQHTLRIEVIEHVRCEMETGSGGGGRAGLDGEHGLIPFIILKLLRYVWGERDTAEVVQVPGQLAIELDERYTVREFLDEDGRPNPTGTVAVTLEQHLLAGLEPPGGTDECSPKPTFFFSEQQDLDSATAPAMSDHSGRDDPGVVHDDEVARTQQRREIAEVTMSNVVRRAIEHQQSTV